MISKEHRDAKEYELRLEEGKAKQETLAKLSRSKEKLTSDILDIDQKMGKLKQDAKLKLKNGKRDDAKKLFAQILTLKKRRQLKSSLLANVEVSKHSVENTEELLEHKELMKSVRDFVIIENKNEDKEDFADVMDDVSVGLEEIDQRVQSTMTTLTSSQDMQPGELAEMFAEFEQEMESERREELDKQAESMVKGSVTVPSSGFERVYTGGGGFSLSSNQKKGYQKLDSNFDTDPMELNAAKNILGRIGAFWAIFLTRACIQKNKLL